MHLRPLPHPNAPWAAACGALVGLIVALGAPLTQAAPVSWSKLPSFAKLGSGQAIQLKQALETFSSYHGCTETVASCLRKERNRGTELAWRLAEYAIFLASRDLKAAAILTVLDRRKVSSLPAVLHTIPLAGWPRLGPAEAKVVLVEYADFRCAHCAKVAPLLLQLLKRYPKDLAIVFKTYPLRTYGESLLAAQAALAAHKQGQFWPMAELLFRHQDKHHLAGLNSLAAELKLDLPRFSASLAAKDGLRMIERAKIEGLRQGISSTPALFFNGKRYLLRKDERHLRNRIEEELLLLNSK